ncbi:MAG: hypothetical protein RQ722_12410, partial [Desulfuromonadales bacterium]|nr:hypothetical protein [Desulfuromonadales bacterium]
KDYGLQGTRAPRRLQSLPNSPHIDFDGEDRKNFSRKNSLSSGQELRRLSPWVCNGNLWWFLSCE